MKNVLDNRIQIFRGDGKSKNTNTYRLVTELAEDIWTVVKIFDVNNRSSLTTIKYHFGSKDDEFPLETAWNMNKCHKLEVGVLDKLFMLNMKVLIKHTNKFIGERPIMEDIINGYMSMSPGKFSDLDIPLYYSKETNKYRIFVSADKDRHLIIKFSVDCVAENFAIKFRDDSEERIAKYYSAVKIKKEDKREKLIEIYHIIIQIFFSLQQNFRVIELAEDLKYGSTFSYYKEMWNEETQHVISKRGGKSFSIEIK